MTQHYITITAPEDLFLPKQMQICYLVGILLFSILKTYLTKISPRYMLGFSPSLAYVSLQSLSETFGNTHKITIQVLLTYRLIREDVNSAHI